MSSTSLQLAGEDRPRIDRVEGLLGLGATGVGGLMEYLDDRSWMVRRSAVAALAALGPVAARPLCDLLQLRRDNEARLSAAVDALAASSGAVDLEVLELCDSRSPAVICDGAQILGRRRSYRAIPTLARLTTHPDDNVALAAIEALGRIGGEAAVEPLLAVVATRSFFRTFPALDVLGRSGDPRAIAPLAALVDDPLFGVEAIRALGHTSSEGGIPALLTALDSEADARRWAAATSIAEIHDRIERRSGQARTVEQRVAQLSTSRVPISRLTRGFAMASPNEQVAVCRLLAWIESSEATTALIGLAGVAPDAVSAALAPAGRGSVPLLREAVKRGDSAQRRLLLPLLRGLPDTFEEGLRCLDDPDPGVRILACDVLARSTGAGAVRPLFSHLDDLDIGVVQALVGAIQALGTSETEALAVEAARSPVAGVRRAGLRILSYFGFPSALGVLLEALAGDDERAAELALTGLPLIEDPAAVAAVLQASQRSSAKVRAAAVRALGQCPVEPRSSLALERGILDPDAWVRYYAAQALGRRREEQSVSRLVKCLDDPAGQVQVAAVEALSHLESPEALSALHLAVEASDSDVRRAALLGLGLKKQPDSLPVLLAAATSPDASTRLVAIAALEHRELGDILSTIQALARDAEASVRGAALALLGDRAGVAAGWALVELLGFEPVRDRVVDILSKPGTGRIPVLIASLQGADAEGAQGLVAALARQSSPDAQDALVATLYCGGLAARRAVAEALGRVHGAAATLALERAAQLDADPQVRRQCLEALSVR